MCNWRRYCNLAVWCKWNERRDQNSTLQVPDSQKAKELFKSFSLFIFSPSSASCHDLSESEARRVPLASLSTTTRLAQGLQVYASFVGGKDRRPQHSVPLVHKHYQSTRLCLYSSIIYARVHSKQHLPV